MTRALPTIDNGCMGISGLSQQEAGEWGWTIHVDHQTGAANIVFYDDDEVVCTCDDEDCDKLDDRSDAHSPHERAIVYRHPDDLGDGRGYWLIDLHHLFALPDGVEPRFPRETITAKQGWVYAVAIVPELTFRRFKVGFTSKPVEQRLKSFRTANPHVLLLGLWEADAADEDRVHRHLPGRIGKSEVFEADAEAILSVIDRVLNEDQPP